MDALDGGMWQYGDDSYPEAGVTFFAGTFVRHPLALAAARAVLQHFKEAGPASAGAPERADRAAGSDAQRLLRAARRPDPDREFRPGSSISDFPPTQRFRSLLYYHLRDKGIHIQEGFPCFLTTAHSDADIDEHASEPSRRASLEMQAGRLPRPRERGEHCSSLRPRQKGRERRGLRQAP